MKEEQRKQKILQIIQKQKPLQIIPLADILSLIEKINPVWEMICGQINGGPGPVFLASITLPQVKTQLDIIVAVYTEFFSPPSYKPIQWQLTVAQGDEQIFNQIEYMHTPDSSVLRLFNRVSKQHEMWQILNEPQCSIERVHAAISLFLDGQLK